MSKKSQSPPIHIVWFKRDLRVRDHAALSGAVESGAPVLPLYIAEPSVTGAADFDPAHWTFIQASLEELRENLAVLGQPLIVRIGEAVATFESLCRQFPVEKIWAHEETGNGLTFERDKAVRRWACARGVVFVELPQNGVIRGLKNRDQWEDLRDARMRQPLLPAPEAIRPLESPIVGRIPSHQQLRLKRDRRETQLGGEARAHELLDSFLHRRGAEYVSAMSSPLSAPDACSRLSPHLAWGTLSVRAAVQAVAQRQRELRRMAAEEREALGGRWQLSLRAFESRLAWRDHFMQKLEMEPEIEFEHYIRTYDGMRSFDQTKFEAWCAGQTGYPMVDACMRYLNKKGWLNFRMRAMLISFASHDLWLHWREPALHLAQSFVDYEPGIHYPQIQMQSGTAGNEALRIYDPVKQGQDHDPLGVFVREWLPELAGVPTSFVHAPWLMPREMQQKVGCVVGEDYPRPIVNHEAAVRHARERITAIRRLPETEDAVRESRGRHASRRPKPAQPRKKKATVNPKQMRLFD